MERMQVNATWRTCSKAFATRSLLSARLFAVIFLHQREAHASDMRVSFLGGQLCMEQGACLAI